MKICFGLFIVFHFYYKYNLYITLGRILFWCRWRCRCHRFSDAIIPFELIADLRHKRQVKRWRWWFKCFFAHNFCYRCSCDVDLYLPLSRCCSLVKDFKGSWRRFFAEWMLSHLICRCSCSQRVRFINTCKLVAKIWAGRKKWTFENFV